MKQSYELDVVCIDKVLKYINAIDELYSLHNVTCAADLNDSLICQLAVTQAITNIYELKQKIQAETLAELPLFAGMHHAMRNARNIASHDYDSVDFGIIYRMTKQLLSEQVIKELGAAKVDTERSQTDNT